MAVGLDIDRPLPLSNHPSDRSISGGRIVPVDNFKAVLVAWIIACHALLGYTAIGGWPYDEVTEVTLSPRAELVLSAVGADGTFCHQHLLLYCGAVCRAMMTHVGP